MGNCNCGKKRVLTIGGKTVTEKTEEQLKKELAEKYSKKDEKQ